MELYLFKKQHVTEPLDYSTVTVYISSYLLPGYHRNLPC
jgi:hypothetical protein